MLGTARTLRKVLDCGKDLWKQGWGDLIKKKIGKGENEEGEENCSKNWKGEKECKRIGEYRFLETQEMDSLYGWNIGKRSASAKS